MAFFEWFYKVAIIQSICILAILSSVLVTKYFFKNEYSALAEFYKTEILSDTSVYEVLSDAV